MGSVCATKVLRVKAYREAKMNKSQTADDL